MYEGFEDLLDRTAAFLRPMMLREPPALGSRHPADLVSLLREGGRAAGLGRRDVHDLVRIFTMSVADLLDDWFEHEGLKGSIASTGVVGVWAGPRTPGTAYNLLHHALGEIDGIPGGWGQVIGGMGAISQAIARSAEAAGAEIRTSAPVASIDVRDGRVVGVTLADGEEIRAPIVASGAHPKTTILDLAGAEHFPEDVARDMRRYRTRGGSVKINLVLSEAPRYEGVTDEQQHMLERTGVNLCPSIDYLERAWQDALAGRPAAEPYVEAELPSAIDSSLTDDGRWVMTMFTQYGPPGEEAWRATPASATPTPASSTWPATRRTCRGRSSSARCWRPRTWSESSASWTARSSRASRASTRWRSCDPRPCWLATRPRSTASTCAAPAPIRAEA